MKTIIAVAILFICSICHGQYSWTKGELHLKDTTVLKGLMKIPKATKNIIKFSGKEKVKFKVDVEQKTHKYFEKDIDKIVFYNGSTYRFITVSENKKLLCKFVQKGNVTLYARKVGLAQSNQMYTGNGTWTTGYIGMNYVDEYYAIKKDEKIASHIVKYGLGSSFKKIAIRYFSDCAPVVSKIEDKTYKKKDIIALVNEYNKCIQ